jgi:hypothetical protein
MRNKGTLNIMLMLRQCKPLFQIKPPLAQSTMTEEEAVGLAQAVAMGGPEAVKDGAAETDESQE